MPGPPCERFLQGLASPAERDVDRVHRMRCNRRSQGGKTFEYLVDEPSTWISEDQLRVPLGPTLLAELQGK
jgi:hypothetical protein